MNNDFITTGIENIFATERNERQHFTPGRYPMKYAHQFASKHREHFFTPAECENMDSDWSATMPVLRDKMVASGVPVMAGLVALADAYIAEHDLVAPKVARGEALIKAVKEGYKSYGHETKDAAVREALLLRISMGR